MESIFSLFIKMHCINKSDSKFILNRIKINELKCTCNALNKTSVIRTKMPYKKNESMPLFFCSILWLIFYLFWLLIFRAQLLLHDFYETYGKD